MIFIYKEISDKFEFMHEKLKLQVKNELLEILTRFNLIKALRWTGQS